MRIIYKNNKKKQYSMIINRVQAFIYIYIYIYIYICIYIYI